MIDVCVCMNKKRMLCCIKQISGMAFPTHEGGSTAFSHDITAALHSDGNSNVALIAAPVHTCRRCIPISAAFGRPSGWRQCLRRPTSCEHRWCQSAMLRGDWNSPPRWHVGLSKRLAESSKRRSCRVVRGAGMLSQPESLCLGRRALCSC